MEQIVDAMIQWLRQNGMTAFRAVPPEKMPLPRKPVVAVEAWEVCCKNQGFYDYLGMTDGQELYGRQMEVKLRLEVFAAEQVGADAVRKGVEQLVERLMEGSHHWKLGDITVEACGFRAVCDCFVGTVWVPVKMVSYAVYDEDREEFVDFVLKGELK